MRTGQILAALGAILLLLAVLAFPMFLIPQQPPAKAIDISLGLWMAIAAVALIACTAVGFWLRKAKNFAVINVAIGGLLLAMVAYLAMSAPYLFSESHQLPFNDDKKFIGYMSGASGLYLAFVGAILAIVGALVTIGSQAKYGKDTRFLRLALLWKDDIVKEMVLEQGRNVTVGEAGSNDFVVNGTPDSMTLFVFGGGRRPDNYSLSVKKELEGSLHLAGKTGPVASHHGKDVAIKDGDWGVFRFGETSLFFQFAQPAFLAGNKYFGSFDSSFASSVMLSVAVQVAFLLSIIISPTDMNYASRSKDTFARMIKIETRRMDKEKEKEKKEEEQKIEETKKEEKEEKLPEEVPEEQPPMPDKPIEKAGDPLKKDIDLKDLMKKNQLKPMKDDHRGLDAKRDKLAKDKKQGMVAILKNQSRKKSALSSVLGKQKNLSAKNAVWGEDGDYVLENEGQSDLAYDGSLNTGDYGGGGLGGAGGFGDGGGGGGFGGGGAFGMGGMGGLGGLGGIGGADASRAGRMAMAGLKDKGRRMASKVSLGSGGVSGFCKKQDVLKTVQRRAAAIRSCYEVALQLNPNLKGKIVVKWTINLEGKVQGVQIVSDSMNNARVQECMSKVIGHMRFMKPSGGICIIQWPFVFTSSAE